MSNSQVGFNGSLQVWIVSLAISIVFSILVWDLAIKLFQAPVVVQHWQKLTGSEMDPYWVFSHYGQPIPFVLILLGSFANLLQVFPVRFNLYASLLSLLLLLIVEPVWVTYAFPFLIPAIVVTYFLCQAGLMYWCKRISQSQGASAPSLQSFFQEYARG